MLIIPIGHESSSVRRQPWVSYIIIGLNIIIYFFFTHSVLDSNEAEIAFRDVILYALEHPSTRLDPAFQKLVNKGILHKYKKTRIEADELSDEQEKLSALTEAFLSLYQNDTYRKWGYIPSRKGHFHTLVTSIFLHGGFWHVMGNMFMFFLCGPFVEDRWGRTLFSLFYLVAGIIAALIHGVYTSNPDIPVVGASGAIAGVMGAFLVLFFRTRIRFFYFFFFALRFIKGTFHVPAYIVLPIWLLNQYVNAKIAADSGVAFWAHIGGFIAGAGFALAVKLSRLEERFIDPHIEEKITFYESHPLFDKALEEIEAGRPREAIRILEGIVKEAPDDVNALDKLLDLYLDAGDEIAVRRIGSKLIGFCLKDNEPESAMDIYIRMQFDNKGISPEPKILYNLAALLEKMEQRDKALLLYEELATAFPKHLLALKSLMKLADHNLRNENNFRRAFSFYVLAKHHPDADQRMAPSIEREIKKIRELGGEYVANMREADVEGLERYDEAIKETAPSAYVKSDPVDLLGLSAKGLKVKMKQREPIFVPWGRILAMSTAAIRSQGASSSKVAANTILIDLFYKKALQNNTFCHSCIRLESSRLPVERLFKRKVSVIKACTTVIGFLLKHISSQVIPPRDSSSRFKLPVYDSVEAYEQAIVKSM